MGKVFLGRDTAVEKPVTLTIVGRTILTTKDGVKY
jgi:hypothetical protein